MSETIWRCPVCGGALHPVERSLKCENRHSFDRSRKGDVHLLPANKMHAKLPGDNPEMVRARHAFLQKGYYAHLLRTLCEAADGLPDGGVLLDAGCGEGYYTAGVLHSLDEKGKTCHAYGVDISKTAAGYAAKADPRLDCAVASVFHLPVHAPEHLLALLRRGIPARPETGRPPCHGDPGGAAPLGAQSGSL